MDWMQSRGQLLHGSAPAGVPSFKLVDANNRVRELTDPLKRQLGATSAFYQPQLSDDGLSAAELEEQRQLEQQLQVQKEEMCFISPLPRPNSDVPRLRVPSTSHAFTYGGSSSSNVHSTPPLAPPVSPFASMALSAPAAPVGKAHNPFLSAKVEKSPRLPSFNAIRNSPGTHLKSLGIASRPPPLSLRSFSDVSTLSSSSQSPSPSPSPLHQPQMLHQHHPKAPLRSMSNSSLTSAASTSPMLYSQSLPGVSFLQDRRRSRMSFDGSDRMSISSEDEDSGMRLLSSSVGRTEGNSDAMTAAANAAAQAALNSNGFRSGRVCRYANCSNIARSRGLCRTHGGGKRCSHPNCNKSAQANRKCIAHGGGTPCSFGDCEKTAQSRGLCKAHGGGARCKHPDCPKSSQSKGLCRGHGGGIKCKAEGCEKWVQKNGYCIKHGRERAMTS
uniref:WRKY19-like zinc finger domain-containing protein n=1 Tax=Phytophthora ramorum TaxID=164328 RepID=H3H3C0_PHYRM